MYNFVDRSSGCCTLHWQRQMMKKDAILRKPRGFWSNNKEREREMERRRDQIYGSPFEEGLFLNATLRHVASLFTLDCLVFVCAYGRYLCSLSATALILRWVEPILQSWEEVERFSRTLAAISSFEFSFEPSKKKKKKKYVRHGDVENLWKFIYRTYDASKILHIRDCKCNVPFFMVRRQAYHRSNKTLLFITRSIAVSARFNVDKKKEREREEFGNSVKDYCNGGGNSCRLRLLDVHVHACTFVPCVI